ncbi:MAG: META domain-containing protein [Actinomycetota bacterium]|nr:META domain-containing protein [Actinomycetota bacterium]
MTRIDEAGNRRGSRQRLTGMRLLIVPTLAALVLAACGGGEASSDVSSRGIPDGDWRLAEGVTVVADFPITLSIAGSDASGRAACNSYFGTVVVNGSAISFGQLGQTQMACEPAVMDAETTFMTALGTIERFDVSGDRLTLSGTSPDLVFERVVPVPTADLVDTLWILETVIDGDTASSVGGDPATLLLAGDGTLTASTGCRTLTGRWLENGGVIVVPELAADGECPSDLSRQDSQVVTVIGDEFRAEIDGNVLTLTSMGGDGLVYRAEG